MKKIIGTILIVLLLGSCQLKAEAFNKVSVRQQARSVRQMMRMNRRMGYREYKSYKELYPNTIDMLVDAGYDVEVGYSEVTETHFFIVRW